MRLDGLGFEEIILHQGSIDNSGGGSAHCTGLRISPLQVVVGEWDLIRDTNLEGCEIMNQIGRARR